LLPRRRWRSLVTRTIRSLVAVNLPLFFEQELRFVASYKSFSTQAFVAQLAVNAFSKPVLPRAAWLAIGRPHIHHAATASLPLQKICIIA
jgi:hypothetical protein